MGNSVLRTVYTLNSIQCTVLLALLYCTVRTVLQQLHCTYSTVHTVEPVVLYINSSLSTELAILQLGQFCIANSVLLRRNSYEFLCWSTEFAIQNLPNCSKGNSVLSKVLFTVQYYWLYCVYCTVRTVQLL